MEENGLPRAKKSWLEKYLPLMELLVKVAAVVIGGFWVLYEHRYNEYIKPNREPTVVQQTLQMLVVGETDGYLEVEARWGARKIGPRPLWCLPAFFTLQESSLKGGASAGDSFESRLLDYLKGDKIDVVSFWEESRGAKILVAKRLAIDPILLDKHAEVHRRFDFLLPIGKRDHVQGVVQLPTLMAGGDIEVRWILSRDGDLVSEYYLESGESAGSPRKLVEGSAQDARILAERERRIFRISAGIDKVD